LLIDSDNSRVAFLSRKHDTNENFIAQSIKRLKVNIHPDACLFIIKMARSTHSVPGVDSCRTIQ